MGTGLPPLLKVQIAADAIHDGECRPQGGGQGDNGLHEPLGVEAPLLPVGQTALAVLEGAGHAGLAVALEHRQIDEVPRVQRPAADVHGPQGGVHLAGFVSLEIIQGHAVLLPHRVVSGGAEGPAGAVPHPGALDDGDVSHPVLPQVLDGAGEDAGVGGGTVLRLASHHQVGLECHGRPGGDGGDHLRPLHQGDGHGVGVAAEDLIDGAHWLSSFSAGAVPAD